MLYDQGYTIGGARQRMEEEGDAGSGNSRASASAVDAGALRDAIAGLEDVVKVLSR